MLKVSDQPMKRASKCFREQTEGSLRSEFGIGSETQEAARSSYSGQANAPRLSPSHQGKARPFQIGSNHAELVKIGWPDDPLGFGFFPVQGEATGPTLVGGERFGLIYNCVYYSSSQNHFRMFLHLQTARFVPLLTTRAE